ncbi:kinase-like protein, partial [Exidia glandulosa HHB12029]
RLQREIRVWQHLDHPNVLPLYGVYFGTGFGELPALVSPWCKNGDICTFLRGRKGESAILSLKLRQILEGLKYLHECEPEVIHGDLKGANILISDTYDVQLCDFGFASMHADEEGSLNFQSSSTKGTWRWMAPELLANDDARHTTASDMWAFGCVVVEVLSGKVPYHDKRTDQMVIIAIAHGETPFRPATFIGEPWEVALEAKVWELALDCWASEPDDRPPVKPVLRRLKHLRANFL